MEDGSDVSLCSPICDDKPPDTKVFLVLGDKQSQSHKRSVNITNGCAEMLPTSTADLLCLYNSRRIYNLWTTQNRSRPHSHQVHLTAS